MSEVLKDTYAFFPIPVRFAVLVWHEQEKAMGDSDDQRGQNDDEETPAMKDDQRRLCLLDSLVNDHLLRFLLWTPEEMELFARLTFPLELLSALVSDGFFPLYLRRLRDLWNPTFYCWLVFLWRMTRNACELFADVLYLLPDDQRPPPQMLGKTLFVDLVERKVFSEYTAISIIGAVLPFPTDMTCAREHARFILSLAPALTPAQLGFVMRNVLLYFARPEDCPCGYNPGESHCTCLFPTGITSNNPTSLADNRNDINLKVGAICAETTRTYAIILLHTVLSSLQSTQKEQHHRHWDDSSRDALIASTCDVVFSEAAYVLIYKSTLLNLEYCDNPIPSDGLESVSEPETPLARPRPLTKDQCFDGDFRERDQDLGNATLQSGKCLELSCKQLRKPGCANVSCKTHCEESGVLNCKPHRVFPKANDLGRIQPRKNVFPRPFHRYYHPSQPGRRNSNGPRGVDRPPFEPQAPFLADDRVQVERRKELVARDSSQI